MPIHVQLISQYQVVTYIHWNKQYSHQYYLLQETKAILEVNYNHSKLHGNVDAPTVRDTFGVSGEFKSIVNHKIWEAE